MQSMRLPNTVGKWDWRSLSSRVPIGDIRLHTDLPWDRDGLSINKDITVVGMNYLDQVMTNAVGVWSWLSLSSNVPIGDIRLHPDLPWVREGLSWNKDITVEAIHHLDQVMTSATGEWNWRVLSSKVPIGDIRLHTDLPWSKRMVSTNPGITVDDVIHMDIEDRIDQVVSMEEIMANPLWPWSKQRMSMNPSITVEMVVANLD